MRRFFANCRNLKILTVDYDYRDYVASLGARLEELTIRVNVAGISMDEAFLKAAGMLNGEKAMACLQGLKTLRIEGPKSAKSKGWKVLEEFCLKVSVKFELEEWEDE